MLNCDELPSLNYIIICVAAVYMNLVHSTKENNLAFLKSEGVNLHVALRFVQVILLTAHGNTLQ
jgi:hypothetical protein